MRSLCYWAYLFGSLWFWGCSGSDLGPGDLGAYELSIYSGDGQGGRAGFPLSDSLVVLVRDLSGSPLEGVAVDWEVRGQPLSGGNVVRGVVSPTRSFTDIEGLASVSWRLGSVAGRNRVSAVVRGLGSVDFEALGRPGPPTSLALRYGDESIDTFELALGDTLRLTALVTDHFGNRNSGVRVGWYSGDEGVVSVDSSGLVRGVGPGSSDISALVGIPGTGDTLRSEVAIRVFVPGRLEITGIEPEVLVPGGAAILSGSGFNPDPAKNIVTVGGHNVAVRSASRDRLVVVLPPSSAFGCEATGPTRVVVRVLGSSASYRQRLAVANRLPELGRGDYLNLVDPRSVECNELPAGGRYLISIYSTARSSTATSSFVLTGGDRVAASDIASAEVSSDLVGMGGDGAEVSDRAGGHLELLEANIELLERFGGEPSPVSRGEGGSGPLASLAPRPLIPGTILQVRVPDIRGDLCEDYRLVRARVVYAGSRGVILEDRASPLAGSLDELYRALGDEFEEVMYPLIEEYFGDPLAYDAGLGGGGKVLMLFSPEVNRFGNVAGFVTSADLIARSRCPSSNEAQIFYAIVPTDAASRSGSRSVSGWYRSIRSTVIHEVKHITSFAERLSRGGRVFEESWLEEATARIAEELWARTIFGYRQGGRTGYESSLYCEIRSGTSECQDAPLVMLTHFTVLSEYLRSTNTLSPLGRARENDWSFYSSGWHLVRWAIDHHADREARFLRELTHETRLSGVENLVARTGKSFAELIGPWSLSLYWDEPTAFGLSNPSWDMYDIYRGLNRDLSGGRGEVYPLIPRSVEFGSFRVGVNRLQGGSSILISLSGVGDGPQLLRLEGGSGGPPPESLRMAILRVE